MLQLGALNLKRTFRTNLRVLRTKKEEKRRRKGGLFFVLLNVAEFVVNPWIQCS